MDIPFGIRLSDALERLDSILNGKGQEVSRFKHEVEFASRLVRAFPDKASRWEELISSAVAHVTDGLERKEDISGLVRGAEDILAPIGEIAREFTIHYVGHAHIDMNWLWPWQETVDVCYKTFSTVRRLAQDFPDLRFPQSQTSVYAAMEEYSPETFAAIKDMVKRGQWEIVANTWVEGDKNLASGEALVRQILYTKRYFKDKFGLPFDAIKIDWEPDTFGHAWTYPQVLKKAGIRRYYFCRGGKGHRLFWWEAPDGSRVLAWDDAKLWYQGPIRPEHVVEAVEFFEKTGIKDYLITYGIGDHGGGPTRRDLELVRRMQDWPIFPRVKFSTTDEFFGILEDYIATNGSDRVPVVRDELNFVFRGCYSSQSNIKRANRVSENLLTASEAFALLAHLIKGTPYPGDMLRKGWVNTCFNQFHDILPGSGIHATYEYAQGLFQDTQARANMVRETSLRAIAEEIDTDRRFSIKAVPVVVFNPLPWTRSDAVTLDIYNAFGARDNLVLVDDDGRTLPVQYRELGSWGETFIRLSFTAKDVPGCGYRTFYLKRNQGEAAPTSAVRIIHEHDVESAIENEYFRVSLEPGSGAVVSIIDKSTGRELIPPGERAALLEILHEAPHGMTAWEIGQVVKTVKLDTGATLEVPERGPARSTIRSRRKVGDSEFILDVTLHHGVPRIDFRLDVNWLERGGPDVGVPMLKVAFPLAASSTAARFEIPFGSLERPANGEEVPAQKWVDLTGTDSEGKPLGISLLSTSKYGYDVTSNTVRMTLLRSSYDPDPLPELGRHEISFSLYPHGEFRPATSTRRGYEVNYPLVPLATETHAGSRKPSFELLMVEPENVVVSGFKKAEDDDDLILRLYETDGKKTTAQINLGIQVASAVETDLLEQPIPGGDIQVANSKITVSLGPCEVKTLKIKVAR